MLQLLDVPLAAYWRLVQDPCTLNEMEISACGDVLMRRINDISHLDQVRGDA
jgi:hypothetical protein